MFQDTSNPQDSERTPLVSSQSLTWNRTWIRVLTCVSSMAEGYDLAVFSGAITRVEDVFKLDDLRVGFVLASGGIGMMAGAGVGPILADYIGRRKVLLLSYVTLIVSTTYTALAQDYWNLVMSRIVCGCGCFAGAATTAMYIAEVSPSSVRGFYGSMEDLFINVGILGAFTVNVLFIGKTENDWRYTVGLGGLPPVVAILMALYFLPESPRYMHNRGNPTEGKRLLELFADPEEVEQIVEEWQEETVGVTEPLLGTPQRRHALFLGICVGMMPALAGLTFLVNLQGWSLKHYGFQPHEVATAQWATSAVKTTVLFVSIPFVDTIGRRTMLMVSVLGMCLANAFLGVVLMQQSDLPVVTIALSLAVGAYSIGLGPVPFAYVPEIFETPVRAKGITAAFVLSRVWAGLCTAFGPHLVANIGLAPVFFTCSVLSLCSLAFVYRFCPETKGKTLEEITDVLSSAVGENKPESISRGSRF